MYWQIQIVVMIGGVLFEWVVEFWVGDERFVGECFQKCDQGCLFVLGEVELNWVVCIWVMQWEC